jgi:hypothetical protein
MAILTHFGMKMNRTYQKAAIIQKETGVLTKAATDGMCVNFGKEISVNKTRMNKLIL